MKRKIILGIIILVAAFNSFSEELSSEELFNTGLKYHTQKNYKEAEKYYKQWISSQIGEAHSFDWGSVGAHYDRKGGSSFMWVTYK